MRATKTTVASPAATETSRTAVIGSAPSHIQAIPAHGSSGSLPFASEMNRSSGTWKPCHVHWA
jgi:hypothetical protein